MAPTQTFTSKMRSNCAFPPLAIAAWGIQLSTASAARIAGSDFSNSAVFNAAGGTYDNATSSSDDLNSMDNVTVTDCFFANGGGFGTLDGNAQVSMPSDQVTKIDGAVSGTVVPTIGSIRRASHPSVSRS